MSDSQAPNYFKTSVEVAEPINFDESGKVTCDLGVKIKLRVVEKITPDMQPGFYYSAHTGEVFYLIGSFKYGPILKHLYINGQIWATHYICGKWCDWKLIDRGEN